MLDVVSLELGHERFEELLAVVVRHHVPLAVVVLEEVRLLAVDADRNVERVAAELLVAALLLRPALDPIRRATLRFRRARYPAASSLLNNGSTSIFG